jgi:mono/diheme cytochrome c family protein
MKNTPSATPRNARPLALVAPFMVLAVTSFALSVGCGGKSQDTSATNTPSSTENVAQPAETTAAPMDETALGNKVYADRCALCHGPEGKGDGPAAAGLNPKPRNHTDGSYMNKRTDAELIQVIKNGKGGMPAWGSILSDQEINAVLKHVRSLAK